VDCGSGGLGREDSKNGEDEHSGEGRGEGGGNDLDGVADKRGDGGGDDSGEERGERENSPEASSSAARAQPILICKSSGKLKDGSVAITCGPSQDE